MSDSPAPAPSSAPSSSSPAAPAVSQQQPQAPQGQAPDAVGLDALLAPPAATRKARDEQSARLRHALSTGAGISDALFGDDVGSGQPQDIGISDLPSDGEHVAAPETQEPPENQGDDESLESLRGQLAEHQALQQYYGVVFEAIQQVAAQNEQMQRQLEGYRRIDEDLLREAQERDRRASLPDPEQDPQGHAEHMLRELVASEIEKVVGREKQTAEQQAQEEHQQHVATTAHQDINSCVEQWPELGAGLKAYQDHAFQYYQSLGAPPRQAWDAANMAIWNTAYQAASQGKSAGEALYTLVGAWDFIDVSGWQSPQEQPAPAPEPVPAAQRFVNRAESAATPAATAAIRPQSDDAKIQSLMVKAGSGDQQAMLAFLKEARAIGDPRNVESRRRIMAAFGQPM